MTDESTDRGSGPPAPKRDGRRESGPMFSSSWGVLFLILGLVALILFSLQQTKNSVVDYVFVRKEAEKKNIEWVEFQGDFVKGHWKKIPESPYPNTPKLTPDFDMVLPLQLDHDLLKLFYTNGVVIKAKSPESAFSTREIGRAHV